MNTSTDKIIEFVLYAVVEKIKIGLDIEDVIHVAKNELISTWERDIKDLENSFRTIYSGKIGPLEKE